MSEKSAEKIAVVGGGPAGSFFAIHVLREARRASRQIEVLIIEKKLTLNRQDGSGSYKGCNYGAGGISPRLNEIMDHIGLSIPRSVNRGEIIRIWIHGLWKNIPLKVPKGMTMSSVFRGSLPPKLREKQAGLDPFLMAKAVEEGARVLQGEALEIGYTDLGIPSVSVKLPSGEISIIQASFVAVSTGVNPDRGKDYGDSRLMRSIQEAIPGFAPAKLRKTFVFELEIGREILQKTLGREAYFIEYGTKSLPLEHIALVPKEEYLTVAAIGKYVDRANLPRENLKLIKGILGLPQLQKILPDISGRSAVCACRPMMSVGVAKKPFGDRLALIGDAVGSRLYKDGLYSAYLTASELARVILHEGMDQKTLEKSYGKTVKWLATDTRYGKLVFRMIRITFSTSILSRILYQTFATELKIREVNKRPLGEVLWKIASGTADYRNIFRSMFSFAVIRSVFVGGVLVTLRNLFIEILFGLKWAEYGRYPTVVLREKRDYIKNSISRALGKELDVSPDFERMYAIKIKAAREKIYEELGKFGDDRRSYLWLRFIHVTRIRGAPNEAQSIIRYQLKFLPMAVDLRLQRVMKDRLLLYTVAEKYANRGKLIFEIKPNENGNNRLVIYTAFDFKRGGSIVSKVFWWISRYLFPGFVHDVVWNHALCSIKEHAERH